MSDPNDSEHYVKPLILGDSTEPIESLVELVTSMSRTRIVSKSADFLHVEFRSLIFRFVDDVEFLVDREANLIHIRSASRIGHSDMGANRKRVELIQQQWRTGTPAF